jgi:hypothetical protein
MRSIDPGWAKPSVLALWRAGKLTTIFPDASTAPRCAADTVVHCESQYFGSGSNTDSVRKVAVGAGYILGLLQADLKATHWHRPSEWKRALCGVRAPKTRKLTSYAVHFEVLENLSRAERVVYKAALDSLGAQDRKMDVADTVGIGLVALGRVTPRGKVQ